MRRRQQRRQRLQRLWHTQLATRNLSFYQTDFSYFYTGTAVQCARFDVFYVWTIRWFSLLLLLVLLLLLLLPLMLRLLAVEQRCDAPLCDVMQRQYMYIEMRWHTRKYKTKWEINDENSMLAVLIWFSISKIFRNDLCQRQLLKMRLGLELPMGAWEDTLDVIWGGSFEGSKKITLSSLACC